jgi:hypothetical protein
VASSTTSPPSPLLKRLHLGLTALLLAGVVAFGGLAVAGRVQLGRSGAAASKPGKAAARAEQPSETRKTEKEGRYQIEAMDDARAVLGEVGKLGVLGEERVHEAWVFRYRGGFVECKLEPEFFGKPFSSGPVPDDWKRFLPEDEALKHGRVEALIKEGYIVLLSMVSMLSVPQALEPLHAHLGAAFTVGPAGPLHALVPYYHEVWRRREYRLLLSVGPPKGKLGVGFNLWTGDRVLVRTHLINDDPHNDPVQTGGGKDLEPGKELTILERARGLTKIRLKARFLPDQEAIDRARAE